jgi:hypothetical protein
MNDDARRRWLGGEAALGGLLLLLGILVLLGQALQLDVGEVGWPFFVILPGFGLLGLGLATPRRMGEVLAPIGGVVAMAGFVLLVQNATDRFETWAYAWTLVFLVGAGCGRWLVGTMRGRRELAASGGWLIAVGLVGFLGFAVFFEVVIGLGGHRNLAASRYILAALLILAGLALLARRLLAAGPPAGREVRPAAASDTEAGTQGSLSPADPTRLPPDATSADREPSGPVSS